ncbi:lipopolysaccharide assembly protein LapB [Acidobacterium sp. S8]|uniref:tetratricopeptide repeat protein n=1 Tax=Acidobacterium sp. S8 TaxID=1641854 RepID=UPI00131DA392|nr:tetratricopeptide repeat protein [Acidobacterium sp. S8]
MALLTTVATAQTTTNNYERTLLAIQNQIQSGNLSEAQSLITEAEKAYPANGGIENLKGVIAIQQGKKDEAEKDFSAAIRHSPGLTSAYLNLSRLYMQTGPHDPASEAKALRIYEKVLSMSPADPEANYYVAILLMRTGNYTRSLEHVKKLSAEDKQALNMLVVACGDEAALGHTAEASRDATALVAQPDMTEADVLELVPAFRSGHNADLLESLLKAVASRKPLSVTGLHMLGLAQAAQGKLPEAQAALERAFAADDSSAVTLSDLARIAGDRNDLKGALGYLAHARDLAPKDATYAYRFGVICLKMSLLDESRKALNEAVHLEPENASYNYAMGIVTGFDRGPADALPYLTKYHALRPEDAAGVLALGEAYFRANDFETASKWLKNATNSNETAATAHYYLGRIARHNGEIDEAKTQLTQSLTLEPNRPETLAELGLLYLQIKDYPNAEKHLSQALTLNPDNSAANFGLLQLYARTGDPRREEQQKRFNALKDKQQELSVELMRTIEIRPQDATQSPH